MNIEKIKEILSTVLYPGFEKDIVSLDLIKDIRLDGNKLDIVLEISATAKEVEEELKLELKSKLKDFILDVKILKPQEKSQNQQGKNLAPQIKSFVMVSSGKGGVGKSTTTVNLAIALAMQGKKVGILDADIYGPNIPRMVGLIGAKPEVIDGKVKPLNAYGLEVISMGSLTEEGQSLIWRGAMIMKIIVQLLKDIDWSDLDCLFIDMPPGTGDAQLTLAQSVPVNAGVTVTTPQQVSLDDSRRSLDMFKKLNIPIAGIVENMSGFICPDSGKEFDIFGKGTAKVVADEFNTKIVAQIPIEPTIREAGDEGKPVVYFHPESQSAKRYMQASKELWDFILNANADNTSIQPTHSGGCSSH